MTEHEPRLRAALRPDDRDHGDADRIVDAVLAGQPAQRTAFGSQGRPRRRWAVPLAAAAAVLALVAAAGAWRSFGPQPQVPTPAVSAAEALPTLLTITCGPGGTTVDAGAVAASSDGVHVRIVNDTGAPAQLRVGGDAADAATLEPSPVGTSDAVLRRAPGSWELSCASGRPAHVTLADPHSYYRGGALDLRCDGHEFAVDVPNEAAGRGNTPEAALYDLSRRQGQGVTTEEALIFLGYRDDPTPQALIELADNGTMLARVTAEPSRSASGPRTVYVAWPDMSCSTPYTRRVPAAAPVEDDSAPTRPGPVQCTDKAYPSWAVDPGYGPTPAQAAQALTRHFADGTLRPVTYYPDDTSGPKDAQVWTMDVDGEPVVTFWVWATGPEQAAFGQGYQAGPDLICSYSRYMALPHPK